MHFDNVWTCAQNKNNKNNTKTIIHINIIHKINIFVSFILLCRFMCQNNYNIQMDFLVSLRKYFSGAKQLSSSTTRPARRFDGMYIGTSRPNSGDTTTTSAAAAWSTSCWKRGWHSGNFLWWVNWSQATKKSMLCVVLKLNNKMQNKRALVRV